MSTRAMPAAVLGVALLTGVTGSLHAPSDSGAASADTGTSRAQAAPPAPEVALEAPASVTPAANAGTDGRVSLIASTTGTALPSPALSAYQRAASVINASDTTCHMDWQLLAAIGRVESAHGTYGGSTLDANGLATPSIIGVALDGRRTARITDTDAGQLDGDTRHDRAVGPMQFIPATWSVVGVDADGDGERNPQDIDDAALAAAVYLCSGSDDLGTDAGRRSAVFRYNHSQAYVALVLGLMQKYVDGDLSAVPATMTVSAAMNTNLVGPVAMGPFASRVATDHRASKVADHKRATKDEAAAEPGKLNPTPVSPGTATAPVHPTAPTDPGTTEPSEPTDPGTTDPGTTDPGTTDPGTTDPGTTDPGTTEPSEPTDPGTPSEPTPTDPPETTPPTDPVEPAAPACILDPATGQPIDAATGQPLDPADPCVLALEPAPTTTP
ncbi:lytic transglycosylase domain-containing protein [Nocardioides sp. Soil796]|uniref:lytic transglycosylase domain-containing protein n=1 Tax=Nocardioides sp. Soil796 TaxID=1736412 RepID=UPI000A7842FD